VTFLPLEKMMVGDYADRADAKAILKKDPQAELLASIRLEVRAPHLKPKGHVTMLSGGFDLNGPLVLPGRAAEAPILHFDGPLQITFNDSRPTLRRNRSTEFKLVVGTPGLGAGTFTVVAYDETIPDSTHPRCAVTFPAARAGAPPIRKDFTLKDRC
jgi:hypothetical protein